MPFGSILQPVPKLAIRLLASFDPVLNLTIAITYGLAQGVSECTARSAASKKQEARTTKLSPRPKRPDPVRTKIVAVEVVPWRLPASTAAVRG